MKKILSLALIWSLIICLCACGAKKVEQTNPAQMTNPWVDIDAETLLDSTGLSFYEPGDAQNVQYRYMESDNLAEMQFMLNGLSYTARVKPTSSPEDISGLHYTWADEKDIVIADINGRQLTSPVNNGQVTELCLWYDENSRLSYSLSSTIADANGFDLSKVACQVYTDIVKESTPFIMTPIKPNVDVLNPTDGIYYCSFSTSSFNWRGSSLTLNFYIPVIYSAEDVHQLTEDSQIDAYNRLVTVNSISEDDNTIYINDNMDDSMILCASENGTYASIYESDDYEMLNIGSTMLLLSDDIIFNDCTETPGEILTFNASDMKAHLDSLDETHAEFCAFNTMIRIENSKIVEITRTWHP